MEKENALKILRELHDKALLSERTALETFIPELKESEDEMIRKAIIEHFRWNTKQILNEFSNKEALAWLEKQCADPIKEYWRGYNEGKQNVLDKYAELEKQGESSDKIHYWTEEEIEPIISDYLRGAEHYGGMIGRLRCLKPKPLEKQGTSYTKRDVDDAYLKGISDAKNELEKQGEQKLTWSEGDETLLSSVINSLLIFEDSGASKMKIDWLKHIRKRIKGE